MSEPMIVDLVFEGGGMGKPNETTIVLGLLLDESLAVPGAPKIATSHWQQALNDLPGINFFNRLLRTVIEARDRRVIETASGYIVRLPVMGYAPQAIDLTPEQVQPLLNAGYNAMTAYLKTPGFPSGSRYFSDSIMSQVDTTATYIINFYGNLIQVTQKIGEVSDTAKVTGVDIGSGSEGK